MKCSSKFERYFTKTNYNFQRNNDGGDENKKNTIYKRNMFRHINSNILSKIIIIIFISSLFGHEYYLIASLFYMSQLMLLLEIIFV